MLVYISGPIKDNEDYIDDFAQAESDLAQRGHAFVNPVTIDHDENSTYEDYMRNDLRAMLECDAIYLLRGWEKSAGAKVEFLAAVACGLEVMYE